LVVVVTGGCVAIGWPLLLAALGSQSSDALDALSRMIAYVTQRPLRLLGYTALAALLAWAGGLLVEAVTASTAFVAWLLTERGLYKPEADLPLAERIIRGWSFVLLIAKSYYPAYIATTGTAVYLLLRRDVDEQETDEVFTEEANGKA